MLLDDVRAQAERMVQRTEIVRQANQVAQRILDDATRSRAGSAPRGRGLLRPEAWPSFEIVLDRTLKTVQAGREKLQAVPPPPHDGESPRVGTDGTSDVAPAGFFDQDGG